VPAWLRTEGVTAVFVTHDQEEALSIADRVAVMRDGRVLQQDSPAVVFGRPASAWVAGFVGDAVFLDGEWHESAVETSLGRLPATWGEGGGIDAPAPPPSGARVLAMLRPEQLHPVADDAGGARVGRVRFTGHTALLELTTPDGALVRARVAAASILPAGSRVRVEVSGAAVAYRP
jgi:iron(III) transport system ATP-binding protein